MFSTSLYRGLPITKSPFVCRIFMAKHNLQNRFQTFLFSDVQSECIYISLSFAAYEQRNDDIYLHN